VNPALGAGASPNARVRNDAIWSLRTGSVGQKRFVSQPSVIPAAARALISPTCTLGRRSTKGPDGSGWSPRARTRKDAICSLVTVSDGQYRFGPQPCVTPISAIAWMSGSWTEPSSSVNVPEIDRAGIGTLTIARARTDRAINARLIRWSPDPAQS
jgi:hypothetical protein